MKTDTIVINLNYPHNHEQQELNAYRHIGSVEYLKRLKRLEIQRRARLNRAKHVLEATLFWSILTFDIWVVTSFVGVIFHDSSWNFFNIFF